MQQETFVTVRFNETDMLGHTNNTSYLIYLDHARFELMKELTGSKKHWPFILASTKCDFRKQSYYDDDLKIITTVSKIGNKSFGVNQVIHEVETGSLIAEANSVIIYFNFDTQNSEQIPDGLRERLELYMTNETVRNGK